jgi:predicted transglutaminase-like cysteine proteinase
MLKWVGRRSILALALGLFLPALAAQARPQASAHHPHIHQIEARHADPHRLDAIEAMLADPVHTAPVGDVTRVPYGWADFCTRQPQECRVDVTDPVDIVMNERVLRTLRLVNAKANAEIEPVSNFDHWGTLLDHWDYPTDGKGDCKIYALWKRKLLLDMGFPRQALLMTIVRDLDGNGHTILTVKTDKGDYILDNMVGEVRLWDETGYKFVKRQSQADPNVWVSIGPATAMPVTTAGVN